MPPGDQWEKFVDVPASERASVICQVGISCGFRLLGCLFAPKLVIANAEALVCDRVMEPIVVTEVGSPVRGIMMQLLAKVINRSPIDGIEVSQQVFSGNFVYDNTLVTLRTASPLVHCGGSARTTVLRVPHSAQCRAKYPRWPEVSTGVAVRRCSGEQ